MNEQENYLRWIEDYTNNQFDRDNLPGAWRWHWSGWRNCIGRIRRSPANGWATYRAPSPPMASQHRWWNSFDHTGGFGQYERQR